jgi:hypothetical protein
MLTSVAGIERGSDGSLGITASNVSSGKERPTEGLSVEESTFFHPSLIYPRAFNIPRTELQYMGDMRKYEPTYIKFGFMGKMRNCWKVSILR